MDRNVDWASLSPRGRAILRQIAVPISLGLSRDEVASQTGRSRRSINRLLDELRAEIEQQSAPAA